MSDIASDKQGADPNPEGKEMPGGYLQYDVIDLPSAVALGRRLKELGRYSYFRGQRDASWKVTSSFARLDNAGRERAVREFGQFYSFVKQSPELLPYLQSDDAIVAVAQHHGLAATTFIDFSDDPEVAGWFASDGAIPGQFGSIFLVNEAAEKMFRQVTEIGHILRFLWVDVQNLWRLQAQQGLFLEAQTDIEHIWPLDRIVFQHGEVGSLIERRHIYPDRKSQLEQAIEQYQIQRARREGFETFMKGLDQSRIKFIELEDPNQSVTSRSFVLPKGWSQGPDERWSEIDVNSKPPVVEIDKITQDDDALRALVAERRNCTDLIQVVSANGDVQNEIQGLLDRLWHGCRPYPYSPEQIARAIVSLLRVREGLLGINLSSGSQQTEMANRLLGDAIEIEMSTSGGTTVRAFVSALRLWSALTLEAKHRLGLETMPKSPSELQNRLQPDWRSPSTNFDTEKLAELFVDQIIPWQIATKRNPVAFSPYLVKTLGRP